MTSPLEQPVTLPRLDDLLRAEILSPDAAERAHELTRAEATPSELAHFLDRASLALGTSLMVAGLLYLVAWNWSGIGDLTKVAALELIVLATGVFAVLRRPETPAGQVATTALLALYGPLFGLMGIVWQTGADAWELFAVWAVAGLPLALAARSGWAWVLWTGVADTALVLWRLTVDPDALYPFYTLPTIVAGVHVVVLVVALRGRGAASDLLAATGLAAVTIPPTVAILDLPDDRGLLVLAAGAWLMAQGAAWATLWFQRVAGPAAAAGASILVLIAVAWTKLVGDSDPFFVWMLLGVIIVGLAAALVALIRAGVGRREAA